MLCLELVIGTLLAPGLIVALLVGRCELKQGKINWGSLVDSIFLDPADPEIFYFQHDVEAVLIMIFIGCPDVKTPQFP